MYQTVQQSLSTLYASKGDESMKNTFFKLILWGAAVLAISAITIFVIYRLAMLIAIGIALLIIGLLVGPPIVMALRYKYNRAIREMSSKYT
jgi:uncharacterized membrane-anchored protein